MQEAFQIMTRDVVTVSPEATVGEVARILVEHGISAVPVVDANGMPIGMVSEGDLIGRDDRERDARRDWWLAMIAEGEAMSPDYVSSFTSAEHCAKDVMASPVVTIAPETDVREVARLLAEYRIKRVPVVRDGRIEGIVSRADLLRALASEGAAGAPERHANGLLAALGERLHHHHDSAPPKPAAAAGPSPDHVNATQLRELVADFSQSEAAKRDAERRKMAQKRRDKVKELIDHHVPDESWASLLHKAREAAQHGETEIELLRFPANLCSDGGRAINVFEEDWPATLRGEAAEIYLRWQHELRPQGFHLAARVLDFPGGLPGDIGLFLIWGK